MSQDQLNDLQPSDHTSDTGRANAPQSTPTLRDFTKILMQFKWDLQDGILTEALAKAETDLESLLSDRIREARIEELDNIGSLFFTGDTNPERADFDEYYQQHRAALQEKRNDG